MVHGSYFFLFTTVSCLLKFYFKIKTDCWSLFVICVFALCFLGTHRHLITNIFTVVESVIWLAAYIRKDHGSVVAEAVDLVS